MGIPLDSTGGEGLDGTGGGASGKGRNIERGVERDRAECEGVEVIVRSMDWKALLASLT